jgi:hypothetical protein
MYNSVFHQCLYGFIRVTRVVHGVNLHRIIGHLWTRTVENKFTTFILTICWQTDLTCYIKLLYCPLFPHFYFRVSLYIKLFQLTECRCLVDFIAVIRSVSRPIGFFYINIRDTIRQNESLLGNFDFVDILESLCL